MSRTYRNHRPVGKDGRAAERYWRNASAPAGWRRAERTPREERACTGKVRFFTKEEARAYMRKYNRMHKPYRCVWCDGWHLATRRNRRKREGDAE